MISAKMMKTWLFGALCSVAFGARSTIVVPNANATTARTTTRATQEVSRGGEQ